METIKRLGLTVVTASVGIATFSGCGSVAPMSNNTKELGTTSEVPGSFSTNRTFFDLKEMQNQKKLRAKNTTPKRLDPITPRETRTVNPNEARVDPLPEVGGPTLSTYVVKKGDTLGHIARKYRVGVEELAHQNGMDKNDTLMLGSTLTLPSTAQVRTGRTKVTSGIRTVKVKKGDTLSHIAVANKVTVKQLKEWNHLTSDAIRAGQTLTLGPGGADAVGFKPSKRPIPKSGVHVVQSGENLSTISYMYGMKTKELKSLNNLGDDKILPDQKLILRQGASDQSAPPTDATTAPPQTFTGTTTYVVQSGDILGRLAPKFGVTVAQVMKANGMSSTRIRVGQKLVIPVKEETGTTTRVAIVDPIETETVPTDVEVATPTETNASAKKMMLIPHFVDKDSDTLKSIADMYGSTVKGILTENPTIKSDTDLSNATEISVPVANLNMP